VALVVAEMGWERREGLSWEAKVSDSSPSFPPAPRLETVVEEWKELTDVLELAEAAEVADTAEMAEVAEDPLKFNGFFGLVVDDVAAAPVVLDEVV